MLGNHAVSLEGLKYLVANVPATEHGLFPTDVHKNRNQMRVQPVQHWMDKACVILGKFLYSIIVYNMRASQNVFPASP